MSSICYLVSTQKAHAGGLQNPQNNLGLVGYWNFEDATGTKATDFSGNGNTGSFTGSTYWVSGKTGFAIKTTASGAYVNAGNNSSLRITNDKLTIAVWVKLDTVGVVQEVVNKIGSSGHWAYGIEILNTDVPRCRVSTDGTTLSDLSAASALTQGTWNHIGCVYDGVNQYIYINGVQSNSQGKTGNIFNASSTDVYINNYGFDPVNYLRGTSDDVRIYNRALSAAEVTSLYGARQVTQNAANNAGLVGYWNFEDATGTIATDFSGNRNTGTLINNPVWANGKFGKALSFSGDSGSQYVDMGDVLDMRTGGLSMNAWIKTTASTVPGGDTNTIMGKSLAGLQSGRYSLFLYNGNLEGLFHGSTNRSVTTPETPLLDGQWHMVTITYDRTGSQTLYIDGQYKNSSSISADSGVDMNNADSFFIGAYQDGTGIAPYPNYYFPGLIDDARIYNRALSAAEVATLYGAKQQRANAPNNRGLVGYWSFEDATGTKATDFSGKLNTGTLTNGPTWVDGKFGKALNFDGSDDYVTVPDNNSLDLTSAITVAFWIKGTESANKVILEKGINEDYFFQTTNEAIDAGGKYISFSISTTASTGRVSTSVEVMDGQWHHIVGAFDTTVNTLKIYVDGSLSKTNSGATDEPTTNSSSLVIGGRPSSVCFTGPMDDVRIYNRVLSAEEIANLYAIGR